MRLQVGDWQVEPSLDRITGPAGEVLLMPKAMAVLVYLAERPGQVVSADELIDAIWQGRPMGDNPVYKCITQLRTVLGDDRKAPTYIATVPTKGHRLIAPVIWGDADESPDTGAGTTMQAPLPRPRNRRRLLAWAGGALAACLLAALYLNYPHRFELPVAGTTLPTVSEQPSIAVLPFINLSPDAGQDYFADGLTEELITQLANLPGLRVIGRTSSFAFKGRNEDLRTIGRMLGVNHVLEGSVRKVENRVRVTAQLINPADGSHLWSHAYDRSLDDFVTIQEEIAKTVASALRLSIAARIIRQGGTRNFDAYDAYLAGLAAAAAGGAYNVLASIDAFDRAVSIDPGFIAAWAALAGAYQQASIDVPSRRAEWQKQLSDTEQRITALAPDWPKVTYLSAQREVSLGNLVEAERLFKSLQKPPTTHMPQTGSYGTFLLNVGRPREAITEFTRDLQAEPLALESSLWVQIAFELAGDFAQANKEYQRSLGFAEDTRAIRTMVLMRAMGQRDKQAIRRELQAQIAVGPLTRKLNESMLRYLDTPALALTELQSYIDDPTSMNSSVVVMTIATWAAYFRDPELALEAMQRLPPLDGMAFNWTVWRPVLSEMRRLPGFKPLVSQWGLVDYWRTTGNWGAFCRPIGMDDFECDLGLTGN